MRIIVVFLLVFSAMTFRSGAVLAQSAGLDEAIRANGAVEQKLALTAAQKSAIFNAVFQQRVKSYPTLVAAVVGAAVPQSVEFADLPEIATADIPLATDLKYAMVDDNLIVVIDPVRMRVVDVLRASVGR
jgi:hypothetical protein